MDSKISRTSHPLLYADPDDIEKMMSAIKERRQEAIEGFRQAGAIVHVSSDTSKILAIVDEIEAGADEDDNPRLIIDGHDVSESVEELTIKVNRRRMQATEIKVVFRPKISIVVGTRNF